MQRRHFLKTSASVGAAAITSPTLLLPSKTTAAPAAGIPDVVAVSNGEPAAMVDKALAELGGMTGFVKKGQTVVVKPNASWVRPVENGANTHPELVERVVEHCIQAGARKVYILDHSVDDAAKSYEKSGIGPAAKAAGAVLAPAAEQGTYHKTRIDGKSLKETAIHELYMEADSIINLPVLKHHGRTKITISMKNLMGVIWDRRAYHKNNNTELNQCIADFLTLKKPTLNIVDAYRVTLRHGPHRAKPEDVVVKKALFASADIVAVDTVATKFQGTDPAEIDYIRIAHEMKIGNMDIASQNIKNIVI